MPTSKKSKSIKKKIAAQAADSSQALLVQTRIDALTHKRLQALASREGRSVAAMMRLILIAAVKPARPAGKVACGPENMGGRKEATES